MTITVTPKIEDAIVEQVQREGTTPERLVLDGLRNLFVSSKPTPEEVLGLAARVYEGLTEKDADEIEEIALNRRQFIGGRFIH